MPVIVCGSDKAGKHFLLIENYSSLSPLGTPCRVERNTRRRKVKGDFMTIEGFYKRLEERGLSTTVFRKKYDSLKVQCCGDDEDNQRCFEVCTEILRSCLYFDIIDSSDFINLTDRVASYYYGDLPDSYGDDV